MAFNANLFSIMLGCLLISISTQSFLNNYTSPFWWMVLCGLGVYLAYIPFNAVLFDRLLAVLQEKANIGFLFYLADFCGYLGSIFAMLYQNWAMKGNGNWLGLITKMALWMPIVSILFIIVSYVFFDTKINQKYHPKNNMQASL